MRVLYFAHDLNDTAVARRVCMLHLGGAEVKLVGFYRGKRPASEIEGLTPLVLGRTYDSQLQQRAAYVVRRSLDARRWWKLVQLADVLLARNLEMAVIANAARKWGRTKTPLIYECLDIHRLSVIEGAVPNVLRRMERFVLRRSKALVISSATYRDQFFDSLDIRLPEVIVAENKRLSPQCGIRPKTLMPRRDGAPWRIGWFGNLRCTASFDDMVAIALRHPSLVEFVLRGRPTKDMQARIDRFLPLVNMRFEGSYAQSDLESIYGDCSFSWGIDCSSDRSITSDWVLPNRLYEGGFYNVPVIALAGTTTADWLERRNSGFVLGTVADLDTRLASFTGQRYRELQASVAAIPTSDLVWTLEECRAFTQRLKG